MDRRRFLAAAGLGALGAPLAARWSLILAAPFSDARRLAEGAGRRPLLLFPVPRGHRARRERGDVLGIFLQHCDDETLAVLLLSQPAFVKSGSFERLVPGLAIGDDPLFVVVREAKEAKSGLFATVHDPPLPPRPAGRFGDKPFEEWLAEIERWHRERIERIGRAVREALLPEEEALEALAEADTLALDGATLARVQEALESPDGPGRLDDATVDAAAGLLLHAASYLDEDRRAPWVARLAAVAAKKWRDRAPPGARWARTWGCGIDIEGEENDEAGRIACGMAFVPAIEQRFLWLLEEDS